MAGLQLQEVRRVRTVKPVGLISVAAQPGPIAAASAIQSSLSIVRAQEDGPR